MTVVTHAGEIYEGERLYGMLGLSLNAWTFCIMRPVQDNLSSIG